MDSSNRSIGDGSTSPHVSSCERTSSSLGLPPLPSNRDLDDIGMESEVAETVSQHIPLEYTDVTNAFASCESRMVTEGFAKGYTMLSLH